MSTQIVELYGPGTKFPAAIERRLAHSEVEVLPHPPEIDPNAGPCFGVAPVDEARLSEVIAYCKKVGFVIQRIVVERSPDEFAMVSITFGQIRDPRLP